MTKWSLMKIRKNSLLVNGIQLSIYSFVNRGFAFILLIILANYISPADYGYLSLFSTIVVLLGYIICLSSEGYLTVSYFRNGEDGIRNTFSVILTIGLLSSLLLLLIITIGGKYLSSLLALPEKILIVAVIVSLFTSLANVNLDYFRIKEKVKTYGFFSCGNALLNFLITIFLIKFFAMSWEGRVFAQFSCSLLFGTVSLLFFFRKKLITTNIKEHVIPILTWSLPLIPLHATNFLRQGVDRYIINYHHTIEDVGFFSFALNIANAITMIGFGFNQTVSVNIYKILGGESMTNVEKKAKLKHLTHLIVHIFIFATALITITGYFIVPILLPQYAQSVNYFVILSVYAFFVCYYLAFTNFLFFYKNTKAIMYWSIGSSILHMLLSFILTKYSLYWTSTIYCISQAFFAIGIQLQANREIQNKLST